MKAKKLLVVFFVFLYFASSAHAQDFSLFSGKFYDLKDGEEKIEFEFYNGTYNICESERKAIPILVVNKGVEDDKYSLDLVGASWASLNVREFALPKKQSGVTFLSLNPDKNAEGNYNIKVSGTSLIGDVKRELSIDINVEKCHAISLELEKEEDKVCGGIEKKYTGEIANDGSMQSDIELGIKGPNWISIDENVFSIDANERQEFELNADVPANAKGFFSVFVSAALQDLPSIKSEKELMIEVVPQYDCYKPDIIATEKITNHYSNAYVPIRIRNSGIKQAIYDVGLEAPAWISIEPKKLAVNPEQFGNLNLNINPSAEIPEGAYPIKINLKFEDIVYSKSIDVVLARKQFLKSLKLFLAFYRYYIYAVFIVAAVLFVLRRQIKNKIKASYKSYRVRRTRLKALKAAREARQAKIKKIKIKEKVEFKVRKYKKFGLKWLFIALIAAASLLFFSVYQFDFPVSKNFIRNYYAYFIAGILISIFIIFLIEFYKPLFSILGRIKKKR